MLAAGSAALHGATTVVLEKGPKRGRKLRMTGKGRCNVSNVCGVEGFIKAFAPNGKFLYSAFSRYFRDDILQLLSSLGVETKSERGGRIFPVSDSAIEVAEALEGWNDSLGVQTRLNTRAKGIVVENGEVVGVDLYGGRIDCTAAIIAAGGASFPGTGSNGDGFEIAQEAGHTIVRPRAALAAMFTREAWVPELQGLSLRNVEATVWTGQGKVRKCHDKGFGEMLFTREGVSGPIILTLSRTVALLVEQGTVEIHIDLKPALTPEALHARFIRDFARPLHFRNYLRELVPHSMIEVMPGLTGIPADQPLHQVTAAQRQRLVETMKCLVVTVSELAPLERAIVTGGGVSLREVDPKSMMSRIVNGLYFTGEVLDLDAETGGFNLQAAWSTGWVAGAAAAGYVAAKRGVDDSE